MFKVYQRKWFDDTGIQYIINFGPGTVGTFEGLDIVAKHPCVIDVQQRHFVGDVIENTGDIKHRAGEVSVLCDRSPKIMKEIISFIQQTIKATDENGNNILISPFDIRLIDQRGGK